MVVWIWNKEEDDDIQTPMAWLMATLRVDGWMKRLRKIQFKCFSRFFFFIRFVFIWLQLELGLIAFLSLWVHDLATMVPLRIYKI